MNSHISEKALEQYLALVEEKFGTDFSEGETYDFTRCVRPDGSSYGTRGKCKKGTEAAKDSKEVKTGAYKDWGDKELREQANLLLKVDSDKVSERNKKAYENQVNEIMNELRGRGLLHGGKAAREAKADARSAKRMGNYDSSRTQRIQSLVGKAQKTIDKLETSIAKTKDGPYKQKVQAKIAKLKATQRKLQAEKQRLYEANPPQGEGFGNIPESMRSARD